MRTVSFTTTQDGDIVRGEVRVRGFRAIDYGTSVDEVRNSLIAHLIDEQEIKDGDYTIEETST